MSDEEVAYRNPPKRIENYGDVYRFARYLYSDVGKDSDFRMQTQFGEDGKERLFLTNDHGQQVLVAQNSIPENWRGSIEDFGPLRARWVSHLDRCRTQMMNLTGKLEKVLKELQK